MIAVELRPPLRPLFFKTIGMNVMIVNHFTFISPVSSIKFQMHRPMNLFQTIRNHKPYDRIVIIFYHLIIEFSNLP